SYVFGTYVFFGTTLNFIFVIHSTISFMLLILAVLFSMPDLGIMKLVSSDSNGGKAIRKTLPAFVFIFIIIGWFRLKGEQTGLYNKEFGDSIFILVMLIILGYLLFSDSASFIKAEKAIRQSEENLLQSNQTLEAAEKMANLGSWEYNMNGLEGKWSKQVFRLLQLPISDKAPAFKEFLKLVHPEERNAARVIFDKMVDGIEIENKIFRTNPENGDVKFLLLDWHVIKDASGKPEKYFGTLQCVTDRIKARNALKLREELFATVFHSKVFGLAIVNKERRVVDINETLTSLLGYTRDDFIGKNSIEIGLTDPEYIKKRDELLLVLFSKGKIENHEIELVTRYGRPLTLLLSVEPLSLNGEPHWLIYLKDITEKKKAEKELAESEYRLRTILETEPECIKVIDTNFDVTYMNPAGMAMMEADNVNQVKGKKAFETVIESYKRDLFRLIKKVFEGTPGKMQYEITGFKGTNRWLETNIVPLKDTDEKIISLICVTRDITESKKSEAETKMAIERYELIGMATNDAIWEWDLTNKQIWGNNIFYQLYGLNRQTGNLNDLIPYSRTHPEDVPNLIASLEYAYQQKANSIVDEYRFLMPDGEYKIFLDRAFIKYDKNGKPTRLIGAMQDITERRRAEEKIKIHYEQLRMLTENLQNIREDERKRIGREIHDELGQRLTILKMEIARVESIKGNEKNLHDSITEMLKQVDDCIQSSRKISSELRPSIIDDFGLIAALDWQAEEFGKRTNIKSVFKTDIPQLDLPPDYTIGIFRIFQESLTNIARHAGATMVASSLYIFNDELILSISDNGNGFNTATIGTKKTLGLIGMKERTLLMKGSFEINSSPGNGTEIMVIIPMPAG
ncbi:MAG: PAS domain S-box protein, partial [Chitinophagaceae bacterium]